MGRKRAMRSKEVRNDQFGGIQGHCEEVSGQAAGDHFARPGCEQAGNEGRWFATAKDAGFYELAIELANKSPSAPPRTLTRAAQDFAMERPDFAIAAGMTAVRGIANGNGFDITGVDVLDAYAAVMAAAGTAGVDEAVVKADVRAIIAASLGGGEFVGRALAGHLDE